ncbi:phytoene desaturase family protein [Sphaerochaeta globosa]|uniref:FAD dependent oxidoreductase n=1 Tax=Sphaerochaeta globosa (strain ATCC BAA-1886 / DSM 22777 / Buddy) TaxID=158189 RepID=F0RSM9_SPHGB|nr:NAD(P)/FAD-dependent oxidoreductase [Sphaerochaeta globosa]ADY14145.1 FAD dependent oxidoreductase [Sphaerochaeta globosa str. Buddy]
MGKHIVVIGAGIAGLSAASYLARNGYQVTVLEKHSMSGGLCTSWKRGGYTVDYCIHWLMGSRKGTEFYSMWQELGAFTNADGSTVEIINFDQFTTIGLSTGDSLCLSSNLEQLRDELLQLAPEDEKEIKKFYRSLKRLGGTLSANPLVRTYAGLIQFATMMSHLKPMEEYAKRFKNPKMREIFLCSVPPAWSLVALTLGLSQQPLKSAGYPIGGSLNLSKNIERKAAQLGVTFRFNSPVEKVLVSEGKAVGVQLFGGETIASDYVVSAADGYTTLYSMLGGQYISSAYQEAYEQYLLFPSTVMVALGIRKELHQFVHSSTPYFEQPIVLADGTIHNSFNLNVYAFDPTLAPAGCTLVTVLFNTWEWERWETLANERPQEYEAEKKRIAEEVIKRLEAVLGPLNGLIDMVDVSTPHSVIRYTGNYKGSFEGFAPTKASLSKRLPKTLEGLSQFAMIGQWTTPGGGLPTAAKDGRDIARCICKQDGKHFSGKD